MKRFIAVLVLVLVMGPFAYAEDRIGPLRNNGNTMSQTITLTGPVIIESLSSSFVGFYPHQVEYLAVGDDTFNLTWYHATSAEILSESITDGTSGGIIQIPGKPPIITDVPLYGALLFSGSSLTLTFTGVK